MKQTATDSRARQLPVYRDSTIARERRAQERFNCNYERSVVIEYDSTVLVLYVYIYS